jgi:SAM-dependent methyltransferase
MGIDVHVLNFLRYAARKKVFGKTLTLGRQGVYLPTPVLRKILDSEAGDLQDPYCEPLLKRFFGAGQVDSVDHSAYEGATHIHDLNRPLPDAMAQGYDTVIDGGCLEHVFNVPQALSTCSRLLKPGGQLIHVLPANNFCGHGFWQFSPELFFSLYSAPNGYNNTEVFIADLEDTDHWYRVRRPAPGQRVNIQSAGPLYLLVRSVLGSQAFDHSQVQQSDYVNVWARSETSAATSAEGSPQQPAPGDKADRADRAPSMSPPPSVMNVLPLTNRGFLARWRASRRSVEAHPDLIRLAVTKVVAIEAIGF